MFESLKKYSSKWKKFVTKDVPKGGIMVGIPAKNLKASSKKTDSTFAPYAVTKK